MLAVLALSCSSQSSIKGTASDTSGTNGATNGTGKVAKTPGVGGKTVNAK